LSANRDDPAVAVAIDATKAQFEKAPLVKGDRYATLLAPGFADEVRRYFDSISARATTGGERKTR